MASSGERFFWAAMLHVDVLINSGQTEAAAQVLEAATGKSRVDVARDVCVVDKDKLDELLKTARTELGPSRAALLRAELEAAAEHTVTTRLWAKTIKKHSPSSGPESAA